MLAKLETRGLIYRQPDKKDGRMVRIFLTPEGKASKALAKEVVIGFNKQIYQTIPMEQLNTFFEVLDSINEIIKLNQ